MLTRAELLEILRNRENSSIEFKRDDIQSYKLAKELVAFSNFDGGKVLLGVEDDGSVSGTVRDNLEEWVMNTCRDKIRPAIIPHFSLVREIEGKRDIAIVSVPQGITVHSLWHNNRTTYFIRVGTTNREPTPQELVQLFQQRGMLRAELMPTSGATIHDLDKRRLKNYFNHIRGQEAPEDDDDNGWLKLLFNTEIMVDEGVAVAGLLLFGKNPNRYLAQSGIDAVAYSGKEKDYEAKDRRKLKGPMAPLLTEGGELVELGLVEQTAAFIQRNTGVATELANGVRRLEKPDYPVEVIRESIVNALIHRDYLLAGTDIELGIYEDRLEIVSPGRLANGITTERMRAGCRSARNLLIKDVMRDYGYLEHTGMGIPLKIVRGMQKHNGTDPELLEDGERFIVRLFKAQE